VDVTLYLRWFLVVTICKLDHHFIYYYNPISDAGPEIHAQNKNPFYTELHPNVIEVERSSDPGPSIKTAASPNFSNPNYPESSHWHVSQIIVVLLIHVVSYSS
jgi:hypothetical protein